MAYGQNQCAYCGSHLRVSKLSCEDCGLAYEGEFYTPKLGRLDREDQHFIELFILASGSLKQMSELLEISYPTVRSRLNRLIERLEEEKRKDERRRQQILQDIEQGRISPKQGMRLLETL
jgi:hypothetical protein